MKSNVQQWLYLLAPLVVKGFAPPLSLSVSDPVCGDLVLRAISSGNSKIPSSPSDRTKQAIEAVKQSIAKPRFPSFPLIECEFPVLQSQNKLGDGSLRSKLEAERANVVFVADLVKGLTLIPFFSPKVELLVSSSSSNSFLSTLKSKVKGISMYSLSDGVPIIQEKSICILVTPSSRKDYQIAQDLAQSSTVSAVVIINGYAKDPKSISGDATMAYFLKALTYNSQVAGYLVRSYPKKWTVCDAQSTTVLATFSDEEILVKKTNTPDLRSSGRLVQKYVDERAIRLRK